ncbi:MAG TPA: response regulator transcription factor [Candidatus Limnocylindrales bacterium]
MAFLGPLAVASGVMVTALVAVLVLWWTGDRPRGRTRTAPERVQGGEVYVAPGLAYAMIRGLTKPPAADPLAELTARERQVLELVVAGLSNAEIGGRLGLAEKTVKHHMTAILGKLEVASRVEAALLGYKAGIRPDEPAPDGS